MNDTNLTADAVMKIEDFIKKLSRDELIILNRMVVERIKLLSQQEATSQMTKFNLGERVQFTSPQGTIVNGTIVKMNKKTVSVIADTRTRWNVHPSFLRRG